MLMVAFVIDVCQTLLYLNYLEDSCLGLKSAAKYQRLCIAYSLARSSYVHLHSLDGALRAVRAVVRVVVDVRWHAAHPAGRRASRAAHSGRRLLAIIKRLYHATRVGTRLG